MLVKICYPYMHSLEILRVFYFIISCEESMIDISNDVKCVTYDFCHGLTFKYSHLVCLNF